MILRCSLLWSCYIVLYRKKCGCSFPYYDRHRQAPNRDTDKQSSPHRCRYANNASYPFLYHDIPAGAEEIKQNWRFCRKRESEDSRQKISLSRLHEPITAKLRNFLICKSADCVLFEMSYLNSDTIRRTMMAESNIVRITPTVDSPSRKPSTEPLFLLVLSIILNTVHRITNISSIQPAAGMKSGIMSADWPDTGPAAATSEDYPYGFCSLRGESYACLLIELVLFYMFLSNSIPVDNGRAGTVRTTALVNIGPIPRSPLSGRLL